MLSRRSTALARAWGSRSLATPASNFFPDEPSAPKVLTDSVPGELGQHSLATHRSPPARMKDPSRRLPASGSPSSRTTGRTSSSPVRTPAAAFRLSPLTLVEQTTPSPRVRSPLCGVLPRSLSYFHAAGNYLVDADGNQLLDVFAQIARCVSVRITFPRSEDCSG